MPTSYNTLWGSATVDVRGREVEHFINNHKINIMNNGSPTRISYDTQTAIDLTMCSANLEADLPWSISTSPGDSDHCPIFVAYEETQQGNDPTQKRWKIRETLWDLYESSQQRSDLSEDVRGDCDEQL